MALETSSPKEGAVGEQQNETQLTRNEGCMPLRLEAEASGKQDAEVPFTRTITGTSPPQRRRNADMPVGYLGRAAVRREQCDMTAESLNSGTRVGHC
jgi:hypothetical protein